MEKELLEAIEAAEKAVAADGGVADEDRCVDALKRMRKIPVTTKDLVATQVGKRIRSLTKHPKPRIQTVATDLLKFWKKLVINETSKKEKDCISGDRKLLKSEAKPEKSDPTKLETSSKVAPSKTGDERPGSEQVDSNKSLEGGESGIATCEVETTTIKVERKSKEEKNTTITSKPWTPAGRPPKLASMIKSNNPLRDKLREFLREAFSAVPAEASVDERDEVRKNLDEISACDPIRAAVTVESAMFEKLGPTNGAQRVRYRSIMFNLRDSKNTDLRRRVLVGHIMPEKLIAMAAEEMASDGRKLSNQQIQEKALLECQRAGAPKATTDQFKCGKCGERKCTYYQLQTRSADEPMTTFVTCVNCNNHWKFC